MNNAVLGFRFQPALCIQCHACEVACKIWNHTERGISRRKVFSRFEGSYPDTKLIIISVACLHCEDPACASICPVDAIRTDPSGTVLVDSDVCIGCRQCADVCPVQAPQFDSDDKMQKCDMCIGRSVPACVLSCPTKALRLEPMSPEEKYALNRSITELFQG